MQSCRENSLFQILPLVESILVAPELLIKGSSQALASRWCMFAVGTSKVILRLLKDFDSCVDAKGVFEKEAVVISKCWHRRNNNPTDPISRHPPRHFLLTKRSLLAPSNIDRNLTVPMVTGNIDASPIIFGGLPRCQGID
jgi:hypothetical protein